MVRLVSFPFKLSEKDEARFDNNEHQLAELRRRNRIMTPRQQKRYDQLMEQYNEYVAKKKEERDTQRRYEFWQYGDTKMKNPYTRGIAKDFIANITLDNSLTYGESLRPGSFVDGVYMPQNTIYTMTPKGHLTTAESFFGLNRRTPNTGETMEGFEEENEVLQYLNGTKEDYKSPVESHNEQFSEFNGEKQVPEAYESSSEESFTSTDIAEAQEKMNMALWMELLSLDGPRMPRRENVDSTYQLEEAEKSDESLE